MPTVAVTLFTDPACPVAFSAEPVRWALRWHYGDQLTWTVRMIGLTLEDGHAEQLQQSAPALERSHGMPLDPRPFARPASCVPACRLVVAARESAGDAAAERVLRALRVRLWRGGLLDDPALLAGAVADAGLGEELVRADVDAAWEADVAAARAPSPAGLAQAHKLGGPDDALRYSAPSYELAGDGRTGAVVGLNAIEAYDAVLANLWPGLERAARPGSVEELLAWAGEPLATAEVLALVGGAEPEVRSDLAQVAAFAPAGADGYWSLRP